MKKILFSIVALVCVISATTSIQAMQENPVIWVRERPKIQGSKEFVPFGFRPYEKDLPPISGQDLYGVGPQESRKNGNRGWGGYLGDYQSR